MDDRIPFAQRPTSEQLITLMSLPDVHYHSFRAVFHDHLHDVDTNSPAGQRAQIVVTQPDGFKAWAYATDDATAPLVAVSAGWKGLLRTYAVAKGVSIAWQQGALQTATVAAPPDETLNVNGVAQPLIPLAIDRATTPKEMISGSPVVGDIAFLLQPAGFAYDTIPHSLLTSRAATYEGRPVTVMQLDWKAGHGRTVTGIHASAHGGQMVLWVDNATGLIFRLEVYDGQTLARWAAFSDIQIDGPTSDVNFQSDDGPATVPVQPIERVLFPQGVPTVTKPAGS